MKMTSDTLDSRNTVLQVEVCSGFCLVVAKVLIVEKLLEVSW